MAQYSEQCEDTLEYVRNLLRNDNSLMVTILGLSGTSQSVNHVFVDRPRNERINPQGKQYFKLPRIVINLINNVRKKIGNNLNGFNESEIDFQIATWVSNTSWSTSIKANDRISYLLENDNMAIVGGFSNFLITASDVIDDPDREDTKMATIKVKTKIFGGNT